MVNGGTGRGARLCAALLTLAGAACSAATARSEAQGAAEVSPADRREIEQVIAARVARAREAWQRKDPSLLVSGPDSAVGVRRPDGTPVTNAESRANLAQRMALVVRVDTMTEVVTGLRVDGDSVEVTTRQRFVRLVRVDSAERVRGSGVTHRQWFRRVGGRWAPVGPLRESEQEAYWADERRPGRP